MARCEDFPCCGHESGCCPDYDGAGRQLNMICTCGARLPISSRYSICETCMRLDGDELFFDEDEEECDDEECDEEECDLRDSDEDSWLDAAYEGQNDMDYGDC